MRGVPTVHRPAPQTMHLFILSAERDRIARSKRCNFEIAFQFDQFSAFDRALAGCSAFDQGRSPSSRAKLASSAGEASGSSHSLGIVTHP